MLGKQGLGERRSRAQRRVECDSCSQRAWDLGVGMGNRYKHKDKVKCTLRKASVTSK